MDMFEEVGAEFGGFDDGSAAGGGVRISTCLVERAPFAAPFIRLPGVQHTTRAYRVLASKATRSLTCLLLHGNGTVHPVRWGVRLPIPARTNPVSYSILGQQTSRANRRRRYFVQGEMHDISISSFLLACVCVSTTNQHVLQATPVAGVLLRGTCAGTRRGVHTHARALAQ